MRKQYPLPFHLLGDEIVLNYINSSSRSSFQITCSVLTRSQMVKQPQLVPTGTNMSELGRLVDPLGQSKVEVSVFVLTLSNCVNSILTKLVPKDGSSLCKYKLAKENISVEIGTCKFPSYTWNKKTFLHFQKWSYKKMEMDLLIQFKCRNNTI